ncbi:hypothetical protein K438DRAFT_1788744 [Mycena galopus ATCC 62051]|nr:hypothetical protein K438DRAFT_1788744 [Mycena galopus ATCC 62051]
MSLVMSSPSSPSYAGHLSLTTLAVDLALLAAGDTLTSSLKIVPSVADSVADAMCPNLVSLSWGGRHDATDYPAFLEMVEMLSRCSHWCGVDGWCQPLQFVGIYLGHVQMKTSGRWREWMQILSHKGINVDIMGSPLDSWRENWIVI